MHASNSAFGGHDAGLQGVKGAQKVLDTIGAAQTRLILSHNDLGDAGVKGQSAHLW